jgi:hypothetical protein
MIGTTSSIKSDQGIPIDVLYMFASTLVAVLGMFAFQRWVAPNDGRPPHTSPLLTVAELRRRLGQYRDDTPIYVGSLQQYQRIEDVIRIERSAVDSFLGADSPENNSNEIVLLLLSTKNGEANSTGDGTAPPQQLTTSARDSPQCS